MSVGCRLVRAPHLGDRQVGLARAGSPPAGKRSCRELAATRPHGRATLRCARPSPQGTRLPPGALNLSLEGVPSRSGPRHPPP